MRRMRKKDEYSVELENIETEENAGSSETVKKSRKGRHAFEIIAVLLIFAVGMFSVYSVLSFKYIDSVFKMEMFYEQPEDSVDILVLGSSHSYQGINTAVLWEEYGYAAYDLCGAGQFIWNTYYYLEEALKTQSPKLIILDAYYLHVTDDYEDESFAIKNTYGMKWSQTKVDAIKASFDSDLYGLQYFFEILQYHSRYSDVDETDFYPYQANEAMYENHKGFYCYFYSTPVEEKDFSEVDYYNEMTEKVEEYYAKILELAYSENIPVIVVGIPFDADNYHVAFFRTGERIANMFGYPFLNFLTDYKDELGLDYSTDFADSQHLNYLGNTKLTRFLGDYISENYSIPDRRGDENYSSWEADAQIYYYQLENKNTTLITDISEYADTVANNRYQVIITKNSSADGEQEMSSSELSEFLSAVGISQEEFTNGGVWIYSGGEQVYHNDCTEEDFQKSYSLSKYDDAMISTSYDDEGVMIIDVYMNKTEVTAADYGLNVYVYDTLTRTSVDSIGINPNNFALSRIDFYQ